MSRYFVCCVAVAPLRSEASDRSEMVSQLLFGERVTLLNIDNNWWYVQTQYDSYKGWIDFKQIHEILEEEFQNHDEFSYLCPLQDNNRLEDEKGTIYRLSPGSILPFYKDNYCRIGQLKYEVLDGTYLPKTSNEIEQTLLFFLNTPYLWGGRNLFGLDCSGYVQIVYRLLGYNLQRDASQQINQGTIVDFLENAKIGDLAFFDNAEGKIIHVGLMLSNHQIIHASGKIRIDSIDNQGIYNAELEKYTHRLRIVKRLIIC